MHTPNRDKVHAAYRQGEEAIVQLIDQLIQELQAPSRDGFKKLRNRSHDMRLPGNRKNGRQEGHVGIAIFM